MNISRRLLLAIPAIATVTVIVLSANTGSAQLLLPEFCEENYCDPPSIGVTYDFIDNIVCWNGVVLSKKTGSICPYLATEYHLDLGVYHPASGWVTPLDVNGLPQADGYCCDLSSGNCTETDDICPVGKVAVWCNDDESPVYNNGDWTCQ